MILMTNAKAIARVIRSVSETFRKRGWKVKLTRSPKSLSRYVHASRGNRKLTVRVSDHKPNQNTRFDLSFHPRYYQQTRLASYLDGRKKKSRTRNHKWRKRWTSGRSPGWTKQAEKKHATKPISMSLLGGLRESKGMDSQESLNLQTSLQTSLNLLTSSTVKSPSRRERVMAEFWMLIIGITLILTGLVLRSKRGWWWAIG